ncbi:PQ loop repeat-domain-containing protein [Mortierella sp. GBAus27b]|nr:PQ loop repeat-domain-containing protein [Mortierella sp. GBAus27b]
MDDPQPQCIGWIQTLFGECKTTQLDAWSFVLGCVSIFCWLNAQIPQIIENFKLRSAASLSLPFLINWLLGDISNLMGCILTPQLPFQLYLAIYFCIADVILFTQWIYYSRQENIQLQLTEISVTGATEVPESEQQHHHHRHHHRRRSHSHSHRPRRATSSGIVEHPTTDELHDHDENLDSAATHDPEAGDEGAQQSLLPKKRARRLTTTSDIAHRKSTSIVLFGLVMLAMKSSLPGLREPGSLNQLGYTSTMGEGTLRGRVFARALEDGLELDGNGVASTLGGLDLVQVGRISAWVCTVFYMSSRMPQLWKNFQRKSVKGLSILMFFWAVMGNSSYSLSIFYSEKVVNPETRHKALQESLPYILGSLGTLVFDMSIFGQWLYYSGRLDFLGFRKSRRSHQHRHHHHRRHSQSRQHSRVHSRSDSMVLSPSGSQGALYSILVNEDEPAVDANQHHAAPGSSQTNLELNEPSHNRRANGEETV